MQREVWVVWTVADAGAESWTELDNVPVSKKTCRVMRLLDVRAFELKSSVHDVFDHVWSALVHVNREAGKVSIYSRRDGE
jgi:protein transport protein DSL1/ZW10